MKQFIAWLFVLSLMGAGTAAASDYYAPNVTDRQALGQIRHFLFVKNLKGDMKAVFDEHGYSHHRLRVSMGGRVVERWRYHDLGLEFTFDRDSNLVERREIAREDRRGWVYER